MYARVHERDDDRDEERQADEDVGRRAAHRRQALDLAGELLPLANGVGDHVDQPGERAADLALDGDGGDDEVEVLRADALGHLLRAHRRSDGRGCASVSTRLSSLLAGSRPSSTTLCRPCLKLWPAFSDAASVISRSGSWFSNAVDALVALEPDERRTGPRRRRAMASEDHERRPGRDRRRRARTTSRAAADQVDELDRAERQVGALEHRAGASASASSARTPRSVARKRLASSASRSRSCLRFDACVCRRCAARAACAGARRAPRRRRTSRRGARADRRAAPSTGVPAPGRSSPGSRASSTRRAVVAGDRERARPRFPAAVSAVELEPLAAARGGEVLDAPRALELAGDARVDRAQLAARAGSAVGAARVAGERLQRRRIEARALDRDDVDGDARLAGDRDRVLERGGAARLVAVGDHDERRGRRCVSSPSARADWTRPS